MRYGYRTHSESTLLLHFRLDGTLSVAVFRISVKYLSRPHALQVPQNSRLIHVSGKTSAAKVKFGLATHKRTGKSHESPRNNASANSAIVARLRGCRV